MIDIFRLIELLSNKPPKSVDTLISLTKNSKSALYRRLSLLKDLGFQLSKDSRHRYSIQQFDAHSLTLDERTFITGIIKVSDHSTAMIESIIAKLNVHQTIPDPIKLTTLQKIKLLSIINFAIQHDYSLSILNYQSTSLNKKKKRNVIPIFFSNIQMSLYTYDLDVEDHRVYKLMRMGDVELGDKHHHYFEELDAVMDYFGFVGNPVYEVKLLLTQRGRSLLIEEVPESKNDITPSGDVKFPYRFKSVVCDYAGIGRFIMGIGQEVVIVGSDELKNYVRKYLENITLFE
jgi:hypothetical protein